MTAEVKSEKVQSAGNGSTSEKNVDDMSCLHKIDQITALQDAVDSLSLAMFEALRGLRDAVAPESGNLGGNPGNTAGTDATENADADFDEFWQSYRNGDPETVAMVRKVTPATPQKREDFIRIHAKIEMEKDAELVKKLAGTVLEKSLQIDEQVSTLPGMHRTRQMQMEYIQELLKKNSEAADKLQKVYEEASQRRDQVRQFVKNNTCAALGIQEDIN